MTLPNIPANPPARFARDTTVAFTVDAGDYPASDGWTLKWALAGVSQTVVTATGSGNSYTVTLARTANQLPRGAYQWMLFVERTSPANEKVELSRGMVQVDHDAATADGDSQQLTDEQELAAIEATIARRLAGDMAEYGVQSGGGDGRSAKREDLATLYKIRAQLRSRIARKLRGGRLRQIRSAFTPTS